MLPGWHDAELWHPAYPYLGIEEEGREHLQALFDYLAKADSLVEAHNAFFEVGIWENICVPILGWPSIDRSKWRCSAAKAAVHSLPRDLLNACLAMDVAEKKDDEGKKIMLKVSKPRKALKAERQSPGFDPNRILWHETLELFQKLWDYCRQDTKAEHALSSALADLLDEEQRVWFMDLQMNCRGIRVDLDMAKAALMLGDEYCTQLNRELRDITSGEVEMASSRVKLKDWVNRQGVALPDTTAATIEKFKALKGLRADVHRVLHICKEVNQTSTAKYQTAILQASPGDHRLRGQVIYHGAGTGRWAGKGLQPHNFKKGSLEDPDLACEIIKLQDLNTVCALYGSDAVMETLSGAIRGVMIPSDDREMIVADFAAIEARCVLWLARQMSALKVFYRGEDIYCDMASGLYGRTITKKDKDERQFGKQAILGLGFQMGFVTFLITCAKYNIRFSPEMCKHIVGDDYAKHEEAVKKYFTVGKLAKQRQHKLKYGTKTAPGLDQDWNEVVHELVLMKYTTEKYRERYPEVAMMWDDQEAAAIAAVRSPGRIVDVVRGRNSYVFEGRFLKMILPSGRCLHYPDPTIKMKAVPWNPEEFRPELRFMTSLPGGGWVPTGTYGGMLVENLTQATARDLMAQAMVRCDDHPKYDVLMSVHDELIAECPIGVGNVKEFEQLMAETPAWAHGCPVDAEGWIGMRYRK
jgi:DNA polymerase